MPPPYTIRLATPADRDAVFVLKPVLSEDHLAFRLARTANGQGAFFVADAGDRLLGHVFLRFEGKPSAPDAPDIEDLWVHPDWRGQGIGSALLRHCEAVARARGDDAIQLSVGIQNDRAHALYLRFGYRDTGREPYLGGIYDGDEEWVIDLRKPLSGDETEN